jgi:hypothetical protein
MPPDVKPRTRPEKNGKVPAFEPKPSAKSRPPEHVQEASEDSFPASDPPARAPEGAADAPPRTEPRNPADKIKPAHVWAREPDRVQEASEDSFPASDPPAWRSMSV